MRHILKRSLGWGLLLFLAAACSEDAVSTYSGPAAINLQINQKDSAEISFLSLAKETNEFVFEVEVNIQSEIADKDREVKFGLGERTTGISGTNFEMPTRVVVPAGETSVILPVKVFKAGLVDVDGGLVAEVVVLPSADFVSGVLGKIKLTFSGDFPKTWFVDGYSFWVPYSLGKCTKAKYQFVYDYLGTIDLTAHENMNKSIALAGQLNTALDKYAADHGGVRLKDDDGSDMKFSNNS